MDGDLTEEQRARLAASRERARARLAARRPAPAPAPAPALGGFLPEASAAAPVAPAAAPPAPVADPAERPACLDCGRTFAHSHLFDTFQYAVCDDCRDEAGAHALLTRTEAKAEFLLRDCDLDERGGPLACVRRRNPHAARGDMRLYVRAAVAERARLVWGSGAALEAERARRAERRQEARARASARRLRRLRAAVRAPPAPREPHRHRYGAETYDAAADEYWRECDCGHRQTYEKM